MRIFFFIATAILFVSFSLYSQVPTTGLAGYWSFSGNANDVTINANNGIVTGATLTEDRFGNASGAYMFDGNDYITIPHNSTLNMSGAVSFSVWVKPTEILISGNRMILGKSDYSSSTNYLIRQKPDGYFQWEYKGYTENTISPMTANVWHNIVVTAAGPTLEKKIYVDNILVATQLASGDSYGLVTSPLTFGYAAYGSEFFRGVIDDVRLYTTVLSVADVNSLFNEENGTPTDIENTFANIITSYPNPTSGKVFVDLGQTFQNVHIVLTDITGIVVSQEDYKNRQLLEVEISEPAGLYFLTIVSGNRKATLRLIKN